MRGATTGTWSSRRRAVAARCSRFGAALRQNQNGRPASASSAILTAGCPSSTARAYIHLSEAKGRGLWENLSERENFGEMGAVCDKCRQANCRDRNRGRRKQKANKFE